MIISDQKEDLTGRNNERAKHASAGYGHGKRALK
jgi:hypothetical protein